LKIVVVRLRLIGDVVFTTPLLRALRRRYPTAEISYVVEAAAAPVVTGSPHVTELIVVPRTRGLRRVVDDIALGLRLRRKQFDLALDLHGGPRSAWLTWATGAPRRIGYTIRGRAWMYTDVVRRTPDLSPRHSVVNQWDLLAPLDIASPTRAADPVEMIEDAVAASRVERRLAGAGLSSHPLIVVHVSAGNPFRRWPAGAFETVIEQLVRRDPERRVIVTSGPSDADAARRITAAARARLGGLAGAIPDIGEWDLAELRSLVARAAVYIGGDSGPMHIAATTQTPIVALLGPTLPERSMPWRSATYFAEAIDAGPLPCRPCHQRHCVPGDFRCLTAISPTMVLDAARTLLRVEAGL
jgi:lipopolysaccharide heptosyltransferase II